MLRQKDIARLTGVSRSTVSAVLNNKPGVAESTRQLVLNVIREHKYQPGILSRSLVSQFSQLIGVVIPDLRNPFFPEIIAGLTAELDGHDYFILCHDTARSSENELRTVEKLLEYELAGFVFAGVNGDHGLTAIRKVQEAGKVIVTIGEVPDARTHCVRFRDREGTRLATKYLIERDHTRIALLTGPPTLISTKEKAFGFVEALLENAIDFQESMLVNAAANADDGYQVAREMLSRTDARPTAVVCFSDLVAMGVYRAAHEMGLRIPDDLSVVGYDNIEPTATLGPPLTTVSVHTYETGKRVGRVLMRALERDRKSDPIEEWVEPTRGVRASVRDVRAAARASSSGA